MWEQNDVDYGLLWLQMSASDVHVPALSTSVQCGAHQDTAFPLPRISTWCPLTRNLWGKISFILYDSVLYMLLLLSSFVIAHSVITQYSGIILGMGSANERNHYYLTPSLIGQAHTPQKWSLISESMAISKTGHRLYLEIAINRRPLSCPNGWAMGRHLWVFWIKLTVL